MSAQPVTGWVRALVIFLDRVIYYLARHWLLMVNTAIAVYAGLPFLAPVAMHTGHQWLGQLIYMAYIPACHQRPERSFFLFGPQIAYTLEQLQAAVGAVPGRYIGNASIGYKVAFCQRDVAIYLGLVIAGLVYGLIRRRFQIKFLSWKFYLFFVAPLAADGLVQLLGLHESTMLLRVFTGAWFSVGTVWFFYPRVEEAMADVGQQAAWQLHRARLARY